MHPIEQFEKNFGEIEPSKYDELQDRPSLHNRQKSVYRLPKAVAKVAFGTVAVLAVLKLANEATDKTLGTPGSADDNFCVAEEIIPNETYQASLDAIRVHEGEYVSGTAVRVEPNPNGTFRILGQPCN